MPSQFSIGSIHDEPLSACGGTAQHLVTPALATDANWLIDLAATTVRFLPASPWSERRALSESFSLRLFAEVETELSIAAALGHEHHRDGTAATDLHQALLMKPSPLSRVVIKGVGWRLMNRLLPGRTWARRVRN